MAEVNELAIIFKKTMDEEGNEVFIPLRIVSGRYSEAENWFITKNGTAYHHMVESIYEENSYGCRKTIGELMTMYKNLTLKEIKEKVFSAVKNYTYYRDWEDGNNTIYIKNKKTGKTNIFKDKDTDILYYIYDKEVNEAFDEYERKQQTKSEEKPIQEESLSESERLLTPEEIIKLAKKNVKGQDEALKEIVTVLWYNIYQPNFNKKNMLIIGPTGVGKTYIFQKLSKIFGVDVVILPIAGTTQSGYVGSSVNELLHQAYLMCGRNREKFEKSIIVLDEIDKLAKSGDEKVASTGVQQELLKVIEGTNILIGSEQSSKIMVDTSKITFVTTGAFQDLFKKQKRNVGFDSQEPIIDNNITTEKLVQFGMLAEFVGRQKIKIVLNPLTVDILKDIIKNNEESELNNVLEVFNKLNIKCTNLDEIIEEIAEDALSKNIGARGIDDTIMKMFVNILYDIANNPNEYGEIILGPNIMKDNQDYTLIKRKQPKRRVRKKESK